METVVSCAPNLKGVHTISATDLEHMLEGRSAVAVPYNGFSPLRQSCSESFIHKLRLQEINIEDTEGCSVDKFNSIVPLVLETSRIALKSLTINPVVALPIMCYGICLENVKRLKIDIGWRGLLSLLQPRVVRLLKAFDFTRLFPNLDKVIIDSSVGEVGQGHIREFVKQVKPMLKKPIQPDRAARIKHLSLLQDSFIRDNTDKIVAEVFPSIERLYVVVSKELETSCGLIWEHWVDLKELEIKFGRNKEIPRLPNLDSLFCGIFPEEVAELRKMDDEYLKNVNIVPVMKSFTSLKNLRKFGFVFEDDWSLRVGRRQNPKFIFSRVTGFIAFARYPALSVTIVYNKMALKKVLSHMRPFASVVRIDYKQRPHDYQL